MKKERRDGLVINEKVIITEDKKQNSILLSHLYQALAVLIGCFAFRSSFLVAIPLTDRTFDLVLLELFWAICIFALCLWRRYDKSKLLIGCLCYFAFLAWQWKALINGFYHLENIILKRIDEYYGYLSVQFMVNYSTVERDSFLLMVMILIPVVALLTIAVIRNRFVIWVSILLLLPVAATFLFGMAPLPANLVSYIIVTLYLSCSGNMGHYAMERRQRTFLHRINSKAAAWLGLMAILLFFVTRFFLSQEEYDGIIEIERTKARIQATLFDFSWEDFVSVVTSFDLTMDGAAGGINGGKLGGVDRVEFDNSEQLQILTNYAGIKDGVYLKGYVGSVYTGHRWIGHSKASDKLYEELISGWPMNPFFLVNDQQRLIGALTKSAYPNKEEEKGMLTTDYYVTDMQIKYGAANRKYLYVPYYPEYYSIRDAKYMQDLYSMSEQKGKVYSFFYYYHNSKNADSDMSSKSGYQPSQLQVSMNSAPKVFEEDYRKFVYQVYTQLPEEGVEQLVKDFAPLRLDKEYDSVFEKITYVRDYLKDHVDYSLEPGKTPWNKDFVEYFLYENKKGYCAHFASSATLMLRAMGVPARYVEGYAVSAKDVNKNIVTPGQRSNNTDENLEIDINSDTYAISFPNGVEANFSPKKDEALISDYEKVTVSVKDYSAHSWVEVYMEGCGWIPVDFTPGSDMGISAASSIGQQTNETNEVTPTPMAPTPTPRSQDNTQKEEERLDNTTKEEQKKNNMNVTWIILMVIIIWVLGTVIGFVSIRLVRRILRRRTKDPNLKAILLYEQIERLLSTIKVAGVDKNILLEDNTAYVKEHCPYLDGEEFDVIMEIVRRARFGKETINFEELQKVNDFYLSLEGRIWAELSVFRKIYLKLMLYP